MGTPDEALVAYTAHCSLEPNDCVQIETDGELTVITDGCHPVSTVTLSPVEMREFASACTHVADLLEEGEYE